jgi:hypothetical protein
MRNATIKVGLVVASCDVVMFYHCHKPRYFTQGLRIMNELSGRSVFSAHFSTSQSAVLAVVDVRYIPCFSSTESRVLSLNWWIKGKVLVAVVL